MEAALRRAAERMPVPVTEFETITAKVGEKKRKETANHVYLRPMLAALATVILLAGCTVAYTRHKQGGLQTLLTSKAWGDVEIQAEKYDLALPKEFGDYEFENMGITAAVPNAEMSVLEAFLYGGYRPVDVNYQSTKELLYNDHYGYGTNISFGNIRDPYWMSYFEYKSEEEWSCDKDYEAVEYGGYIIHTGVREWDHADRQYASWVDKERGICISVSGFCQEDTLALAKQIIDMNQ